MQRPALIFDFGNVIAFFDYQKATARLGLHLGLSGRELYDRLGPLGFAHHLQQYERGSTTAVDFSQQIMQLIRLELTHGEFAAAWADIFTPNETIIPVIEALKHRGYRLILGSNTNDLHAKHFRQQFSATLAHFDRLVLSYEVGHIKPSRDFYQSCVAAAQVAPSDCIFIDDLVENIAGAHDAGLMGIHYRSTPQLVTDLAHLGVVIDAAKPE